MENDVTHEDPKGAQDADAEILAALLRLACHQHGKLAVQMELGKIKHNPQTEQSYSIPFSRRMRHIKKLADLE